MVPRGTVPKAAIVTVTRPGVRSVSPPSSGQPNFLASAPSAAANFFSQPSATSAVSAIDSRKPSGRAPLAARSERLTRSAFLATAAGGSSGKKCTPEITPSVLSTRSWPGGTAMAAASSTRPNAPGCVASGRKCRAIRRSSADSDVGLRAAIGCGLDNSAGYAVLRAHVPAKWAPVRRKGHAPKNSVSRSPARTRRRGICAPGCRAPR